MLSKLSLAGIALGAAMLFGGATTAKADCYSNIRNKQRDVYRAESRYGSWSRQANEERNELYRAQQSCGNYRNGGFWRNGWYRGDGDRDDRGVRRDRDDRWRRDGDHDRDDRGRWHRDRDRDRGRDHDGDRH